MEARPHPLVEAFIGRLLPPACREHVLGDLHERYVSASQYVHDAARTIPFAIWGQIRRTSSAPLAIAQVGVVYVAFRSALGMFDPTALSNSSAPLRAAIPAFAALAAVVLRDAWIGRRPRANALIAVDAVLAIACAALTHALLAGVGSPLALRLDVLLAGCGMSLVLLSGVRIALSSINHRAATANAGGTGMNSTPSNVQGPMQRNLRFWWWTIAVLGFSGWLGLFIYPATSRFRPVLIAWLIAFVVIGAYQRRKMQWPKSLQEGLETAGGRQAYRAQLERRRDEQYKWPARRRPVMIGVVAIAFLFSAIRLFVLSPNGGQVPFTNALAGPAVVAVLVLGMYLFTRRFTNRAAAAFQRTIDTLDSSWRGPGQE
jgi:hypothetical protein